MAERTRLTTYRNSDKRVTYSFPAGYNLDGFAPIFYFRAGPGDAPTLTVQSIATPNGSNAVVVGDSVVLTLKADDLATFGAADTYSGVYDSNMPKSGFVNKFVGGPHVQYVDGSYGEEAFTDSVLVEVMGVEVPIILEGGNIGAAAAVAVKEAVEAADSAAQSASTAQTAAATAVAATINKADLNGSNILGANQAAFRGAIGAVGSVALAAGTGGTLVGFLQTGTGSVATTLQARNQLTVHVEDFATNAEKTTDMSQAFKRAIAKCQASSTGGTIYALADNYPLVPQTASDTRENCILIPYTGPDGNSANRPVTIIFGGNTTLTPTTGGCVVIRVSDSNCKILGKPLIKGIVDGDVWGVAEIPESITQTTTRVAQSYNVIEVRAENCYVAHVLQAGPQVTGSDSTCYFGVSDVQSNYCNITRWLRAPSTNHGANINGHRFYGNGQNGNVGMYNEAGSTNEDFTAYEGMVYPTLGATAGPLATPAAIKQKKNIPGNPSATLAYNNYYSRIEACTKYLDIDYTETGIFCPVIDFTKVTFGERPSRIDTISFTTGLAVTESSSFVAPVITASGNSSVVKATGGGQPELRVDTTSAYGGFSYYVNGTLQWMVGSQATGNPTVTFFNYLNQPTFQILQDGNAVVIPNTQTPASASAAGVKGTICWDSGFLYVCVANSVWKRVAIATW